MFVNVSQGALHPPLQAVLSKREMTARSVPSFMWKSVNQSAVRAHCSLRFGREFTDRLQRLVMFSHPGIPVKILEHGVFFINNAM